MPGIPSEMKALRVHKAGDKSYTLDTVPVPKPTGSDCLIRVHAAGLCHTDMMVMTGEFPSTYPVIGSHEPAGTVVALGPEAEGKGVKVGDRVAGLLHKGVCGECSDCKLLDIKFCPNSKYTGITTDGAFAEYELLDSRLVVPIPEGMLFEQAAPLTCAGVTILTGIKKAGLKPGQIIAISGLGALGHLGVQMAKALGLKVVGIDARPEPIEMTRQLKLTADLLIDASKTEASEAAKQIAKLRPDDYVGWDGADAVVLTADALPAQRYALDVVRRHGRLVVVAQPSEIKLEFADLIFRDITVVGSLHGNQHDLKETVELCHKHGITSDLKTFKMEDHEQMVQSVHEDSRKGKSVMVL